MLLRRFAILILRRTSYIVHRGQLRSVSGWLGSTILVCQWWADGVLDVVGPFSGF